MSEFDTGADYGHVEAGHESESLDQLHQVEANENNYDSQFGVYEQDHASAESTSFDQGHQVEFTGADGSHYAEQDFTSYDHAAAESDHVFAAEGSESSSSSAFAQLDALQHQLDSSFASATELHTDGQGELGVASN
ncbi:hypothetical protein Daura_26830 [Dactylosporangium aurantiacum]|uniref:Uncharacterized protein n=1 Tax=Dactylosporangium aurantiacum TaxID=35754 RepID=A0A9Q9IBK6_9ACTN|nr:hypothetical protein [Dactylosporangium aurantiacum]MDG6106521.1 hypothetical protein [Dactylosporangium aurantiacum]UWZ50449.1 hypothetical protein Daura_26830 [Dactylosporangium aurantiacum]